MKHKKHRRSPAQKAATKKMLAALHAKKHRKAAAPRKARRKQHRKSLLSVSGKHRPVVHVRKRRMYRGSRSTIPSHAAFANPFLSELALVGNPRKGRRHKMAKRHHRRTRRSYGLRLNPSGALQKVLSGPKEMIRMDFVKEAASVAVGFVLPNLVINRLPTTFRDATWKVYASKVVVVSGLSAVAGIWNKRISRAIMLGGGISILLDLYADFLAPYIGAATAAAAPKAGAYYGDGIGTYYGTDGVGEGEGAPDLAEAFAS